MRDASENVRSSSRMGGEVLRYHTYPTIRKQTNADHELNVLRIYWFVFGNVPPAVTAAIIFSDLPEVRTGDLPHPVKAHNPVLKAEVDRLDQETLVLMVGRDRARTIGVISDVEKRRIKACDLLEMAEFAHIELRMGNTFAREIIENCGMALHDLYKTISPDDQGNILQYYTTEIERFK